MKKICFIIVLTLLVSVSVVTQAQENKEVLDLKNKIIDIQNKGKLGFKNFQLCKKIIGYGSYVPATSPTVNKGSKLEIYYEPFNVFTNRVQGQYEIWYTQDMIVLSEDGKKVIFEKKDALTFHYKSKSPVFDLFATNDLELGELPAGNYVFKAVVKDKLSSQTATGKFKFQIQ